MRLQRTAILVLLVILCFALYACADQSAASDISSSLSSPEVSSVPEQDPELLAWRLPREKTYYEFGDELSGSSELMPRREDGKLFLGDKEYTKADVVYSDHYWTIFDDGARIDMTCGKAYASNTPTEVDENRVLEYNDDVMKLSNGIVIEKPFEAYCTAYGHDFQEVLEQEEFRYLLDFSEDFLEVYREKGQPLSPEQWEVYRETVSSQPPEGTE